MAEIQSLTAGRAFALQTDARRLREQQEQARLRVDTLRQEQVGRQDRDAEARRVADQQQLERVRDDIRAQTEARARFDAEQLAREAQIVDQRQQRTDAQAIADENNDFRQAAVDRQFEIDRAIFDNSAPPDTGGNARVARPDAAAAPEPAANAAPGESTPSPQQVREAAFQALVAERDARAAERREAARDAAIQQNIDLQISGDRIGQTLFNPELPRGSVVDVTG